MTNSKRLISLDALRGFTIAGMILVNVPGSWEHIYSPFRHAKFNGLTLADLVFPFFLYIVGASIVLALMKCIKQGVSKTSMLKKVIIRTLILFVLGIFLNWMSSDFTVPLRIAGVLQRIALCYLFCSMLFIFTSRITMLVVGLVILIGYWILSIFIPIYGFDEVIFTPNMNWAAWIDGQLLPGKMYFGTWDPEGILSTLPAIVTTIFGMITTYFISKINDKKQKVMVLLLGGTGLIIAGILLSYSFPINKNVWSSSYVLLTSGLATMLWSFLIYLIDIKKISKWTRPGIIFGANAITAYVLHYLMAYPLGRLKIGSASIQGHFMHTFSKVIPAELASLFWAIFFTFICFLPLWLMYRKKVFVKV